MVKIQAWGLFLSINAASFNITVIAMIDKNLHLSRPGTKLWLLVLYLKRKKAVAKRAEQEEGEVEETRKKRSKSLITGFIPIYVTLGSLFLQLHLWLFNRYIVFALKSWVRLLCKNWKWNYHSQEHFSVSNWTVKSLSESDEQNESRRDNKSRLLSSSLFFNHHWNTEKHNDFFSCSLLCFLFFTSFCFPCKRHGNEAKLLKYFCIFSLHINRQTDI